MKHIAVRHSIAQNISRHPKLAAISAVRRNFEFEPIYAAPLK